MRNNGVDYEFTLVNPLQYSFQILQSKNSNYLKSENMPNNIII